MTSTTKEAKKTAKKSSAKVAKKPSASTTKTADGKHFMERGELEMATVNQATLATFLGLTASNVSELMRSGTVSKNADGTYDLIEQVRGYVKSLRERKSGSSRGTLETEALQLKNERAKTYLEGWRRTRDRQVAVAILEALKASMLQLKDDIKSGVSVGAGIDKVLKSLETVDYDIVLSEVENDDDEEDEA